MKSVRAADRERMRRAKTIRCARARRRVDDLDSRDRAERIRLTNWCRRAQCARCRARIQSQFASIRRHQSLLDAYADDGWRGRGRARPKPQGELARAREKIFSAKLKIREMFETLEFDPREREITTVEDELGETDAADIFCSACGMADDRSDDDILLCDGFCDRAYHQSCVVPVVKTEDIPPEDEGWLCPRCDARVDVIYVLNDEYEHDLDQKCVAADVFAREAEMESNGVVPGTAKFVQEHEEAWPSDESEDEDFDAKRASDDGEDDHDEALSGSARSSSEESSSESESDLIIEGPRRRTKVDYVKLNSNMFGDDEAYEGENDDGGWKSSNASKAEMLAAVKNRSKAKMKTNGTNGTPTRAKKPTSPRSPRSPRSPPSTASSSKRPRIRFDDAQRRTLEDVFARTRAPSASERDRLARELDVEPSSVRIWFMNRRRRDRVAA